MKKYSIQLAYQYREGILDNDILRNLMHWQSLFILFVIRSVIRDHLNVSMITVEI